MTAPDHRPSSAPDYRRVRRRGTGSTLSPRSCIAWRRLEAAVLLLEQAGERYQRTIKVNAKDVPTTDQLFWAGYSGLFYLPSTVAPAGTTPGGLPVGVQIVGPQYGDRACIDFARLLEQEYREFVPPPGYA